MLLQETTWERREGSLSLQRWSSRSPANELVLTGEETVWLFDGVCHNTECDCSVSRQWMIPYISYHTDWPGHYHDHHMLHNAQCNPTTDIHLSTKLNLSSWNLLPGKHRFGNGSHPQLSYPDYPLWSSLIAGRVPSRYLRVQEVAKSSGPSRSEQFYDSLPNPEL